MEEMSPSQLKDYLLPKMEEKHLPTDILDDLVKQNISGDIFLTMKEDDFKEIFPSLTFGVRRFLTVQTNDNRLSSKVVTYPEYLRKFDSEVTYINKYTKGYCVDAHVNTGGKRTDPVRNFHIQAYQDMDKDLEYIGSEVVIFVSACLNDRRDGTIYFGISPSDNNQYKQGEVIGINLSIEEVQVGISDLFKNSFFPDQQNLISSTVRDAKFIPVISDNKKAEETNLWVVEVDVVPSSCVMTNETVRTKLACLPTYSKENKSKEAVFTFSSDGKPVILSLEELISYERNKTLIVQQRGEEEEAQRRDQLSLIQNLRTRLLNLLTGGAPTMQDTIFPFLITSPIDKNMNEKYLSNNTTFIKWLNPEVIFDLDPTGSTNGIYNNLHSVQGELMRVLTPDDFDKSQFSKEKYKNFTDGLANEKRLSWIFCNGYDALNIAPLEPTEWNIMRRSAFQESLRFYQNNFEKHRIIVIICLFSKNYNVMIEACEEVLTRLPVNWILLAETEDIAKLWQEHMLFRNKVEKQTLKERCVIGMPWNQVNLTFKQAMGFSELLDACILPTSAGVFIEVMDKKLKNWCDIDVLSAGDFTVHEDNEEKKKKEVEERFYRGEQVSWLNFKFHDQVLKRDIHDKLIQKVKDALDGNNKGDKNKVKYISILHHPGAGGTTSTKQVLWDLRKFYRCCVVKNITDQTCDQLDEIRAHQDHSTPKPLLIMIDNEDEGKYLQLRKSLEKRGRANRGGTEKSFNIYCIIILCQRRVSLPKEVKYSEVTLSQQLTPRELHWFKVKNESLKSNFFKDKERNVNPEFLLSFNILRENFSKKYISEVVKKFSDDIRSFTEVRLLEIVSLLNTHDPDFRPIQVSSLDKILEQEQRASNRVSFGAVIRPMKWEANLSEEVKVLLNVSSNKSHHRKARISLRVFNNTNIAREILTSMKEHTGKCESEMMMELLESGIFEQESSDSKQLQKIISDVIKKRVKAPDGSKRQFFSKFILYVADHEGEAVAGKVLEELFEVDKNPMTAQQIARFYIDKKNWEQAEYFAKKATDMLPKNSFLWDTYGQVYLKQLSNMKAPFGCKDDDIHDLIELYEKCTEVFRKGQEVSEYEETTTDGHNLAGYFGELRAIVNLLGALKLCFPFRKEGTLHEYLVKEHMKPDFLNFLTDEEVSCIKNLEKNSKKAIRRIDEEYIQIKSNTLAQDDIISLNKKILIELKEKLNTYFGKVSDYIPQTLNEAESCEHIRRHVRTLGATSLSSLITLRQKNNIKKIYSLLMKNTISSYCSFEDLKTLLDTVTVLLIDNQVLQGLTFEQVLQWCDQLYCINIDPQGADRWYLEPFLYFVMYNFPTNERQKFNLCMISELSLAIEKWQNAFNENYLKFIIEDNKRKKRETTLFFLGNGPPLLDIVYQDSLNEMKNHSPAKKWDLPELREKLKMMSGSLLKDGEKIKLTITTREGNKFGFFIQTSHRVTDRDMWQKKVYFFVGFSFAGPRAFGVSTKKLGEKAAPRP